VYRRLDGDRLYHLDAYRLSRAAEAEELDIDAMVDASPLVVEWADRIQEALPNERLWIHLRWIDEQQRDMVFSAYGARYHNLLSELRKHIFGVL
jgi:tRNA threonylcarbamoyladenosine biosynthesis protein TsaE